MKKELVNLVGTEAEISSSLDLEWLRLGKQCQREDRAKVGECTVTRMWIAGVWPMGASKACFVYAEAANVVYKRERLPNWKRLAMVWRDKSCDNLQRFIEPIEMESDPLVPVLSKLDLTSTVDEGRNEIAYFLLGETENTSFDFRFSSGIVMRRVVEGALWGIAESLAAQRNGVQQYLDVWREAQG